MSWRAVAFVSALGVAGCGALLGLGIEDDPPAGNGGGPSPSGPGYGYGDGAAEDAGDSGAPAGDADAPVDGDATPPPERVVFVTRRASRGSMAFDDAGGAGVAGADDECTRDAQDAGLSGSFVAWLSVEGQNATVRVTPNASYRLRSGKKVFSSTPGPSSPAVPINEAATGDVRSDPAGRVWTGTTSAGAVDDNCAGWTVDTDNEEAGAGTYVFDPKAEPARWTQDAKHGCGSALPIYCFQK